MKSETPPKLMFSVPRGFMEMHVLRILQNPHHGYEIMKHMELECAFWKPSPGSVYPILQKLRKSGLVSEKTIGKRKVYILTKTGKDKLKKFESYKNEMKQKMVALFRMIGEDHGISGYKNEFGILEKIHKDPAKLKRAAKLREDFQRQLKALAEE